MKETTQMNEWMNDTASLTSLEPCTVTNAGPKGGGLMQNVLYHLPSPRGSIVWITSWSAP